MTLLSFMRVFLGTGKPRHFMQSIKSHVKEYCAILSLNLGDCVKAHNVVRTDKSLPLVYAWRSNLEMRTSILGDWSLGSNLKGDELTSLINVMVASQITWRNFTRTRTAISLGRCGSCFFLWLCIYMPSKEYSSALHGCRTIFSFNVSITLLKLWSF